MIKNIIFFLEDILKFIFAILKCLKNPTSKISEMHSKNNICILGNGPSLLKVLESEDIHSTDFCTVNFSINSDVFYKLQPQMHVFADPVFWQRLDDKNVKLVLDNVRNRINWNIIFYVPSVCPKNFRNRLAENKYVRVLTYPVANFDNKLIIFDKLKFFCYKRNLFIPPTSNVIVACIFIAILRGYRNINLYGVEHSWLAYVSIGDDNLMYVEDHHYYGTEKTKWVAGDGSVVKLTTFLYNMYLAFSSYHILRKFAQYYGDVKILNCTEGSWIDAFERKLN